MSFEDYLREFRLLETFDSMSKEEKAIERANCIEWMKLKSIQPPSGDAAVTANILGVLNEIAEEQKAVRFDMKHIYDALPDNFEVVCPSIDCRSEKYSKYRYLMRTLRLPENNDIAALATTVELSAPNSNPNWTYHWRNNVESESYVPLCEYLTKTWGLTPRIVAEGVGLANGLLYISDVYTLRRRWSDRTNLLKPGDEPKFRFRITGRADIAVFKVGGAMICGELLWAMEIKPDTKFQSISQCFTGRYHSVDRDECGQSVLVSCCYCDGITRSSLYSIS